MKKIINEKILSLSIILVMVFIPLIQTIGNFLGKKVFLYQFFLQQETLVITGIILLLITLLYLITKSHSNKISFVLSDLFILISIIFCIISIVFSKDINKSLYGEYTYSETPLQVLIYFTLFFSCTLLKEEKNKKMILITFLFLGIFESLVAFLQNFDLWPTTAFLDTSAHELSHMAFGLTAHSNYFAAIATIFTAIFATQFIYSGNSKKSDILIYFCSMAFCCFATLFTYTRLGWVGLFSIIFFLVLLEMSFFFKNKEKILFKKHILHILIILASFILAFLLVFLSPKLKSFIKSGIPNSSNGPTATTAVEPAQNAKMLSKIELAKKDLSEVNTNFQNFASKRGTIWIVGLSSLKKYPLTGVGFDNYRYSFEIYPENFGWSQNKGHNEYIHILVTQGIPAGIWYLAFAFYCCYFPFKKILENKSEFGKSVLTRTFLIAICAYFTQALFNSSVTNVAPYKWILMGLLLPRNEQKKLL